MGVTCSSEISVVFQWTTRHYIPEDRIIHADTVRTSNLTTYTKYLYEVSPERKKQFKSDVFLALGVKRKFYDFVLTPLCQTCEWEP
jgi:hypothetical protein